MNAHEIRLDLASKQRMQKTKDKWVEFAEKVANDFSDHTTNKNISLGDKISFTNTRPQGRGCIKVSFCEGIVFALGENMIIVVYRGKLEKINYPENPVAPASPET